jgi:hypothetical protein
VAESAARIEVDKLAHELGVDAEQLAFLNGADPVELAQLRETIRSALFAAQEPRLRRIAALSKVLPAPITARIGRTGLGAMPCGQLASVLDTDTAVRLAGHFDAEFLADISGWLDPARTEEIVRALPEDKVIAIGHRLLDREDYITLARLVSVVSTPVALGVVARMTDRQLLQVTRYADDRMRLAELVRDLPGDRIAGVITAATQAGISLDDLGLVVTIRPEVQDHRGGTS